MAGSSATQKQEIKSVKDEQLTPNKENKNVHFASGQPGNQTRMYIFKTNIAQ